MAISYKTCAPEVPVSHFCDPCVDSEKGGVRSFFLVKEGSYITLESTEAEWTAAIQSGNVIIVADTRGTYDGGTPKMGAGFGDIKERVIGYDHVLAVKEPNYAQNSAFWEWAEKVKWRFGFRTDTLVHLSDAVGTLSAKAPVEEDNESEVIWNIEAKWFDKDKIKVAPVAPLKTLFRCYEVTA